MGSKTGHCRSAHRTVSGMLSTGGLIPISRSASKRAMKDFVSVPSLMTLSATRRRTGSVCSAHVHNAAAAFADFLEELVTANTFARFFAHRDMVHNRGQLVFGFQNAAGISVNSEQIFDTLAQLIVAAAGAFKKIFT